MLQICFNWRTRALRKVEYCFHAVSIGVSLFGSIGAMITDSYSTGGAFACFPTAAIMALRLPGNSRERFGHGSLLRSRSMGQCLGPRSVWLSNGNLAVFLVEHGSDNMAGVFAILFQ